MGGVDSCQTKRNEKKKEKENVPSQSFSSTVHRDSRTLDGERECSHGGMKVFSTRYGLNIFSY